MNVVALMGRLTKDPEVFASNDLNIVRFTIAVDRIGDGTDFIQCVAFKKTADFIEKYFHKGNRIAVNGRIQTSTYQKRDGTKATSFEVVANSAEFCENKNNQQEEGWVDVDPLDDGGLPFG